jgi:hypothetical protein
MISYLLTVNHPFDIYKHLLANSCFNILTTKETWTSSMHKILQIQYKVTTIIEMTHLLCRWIRKRSSMFNILWLMNKRWNPLHILPRKYNSKKAIYLQILKKPSLPLLVSIQSALDIQYTCLYNSLNCIKNWFDSNLFI